MKKSMLGIVTASLLLTGCASVPMVSDIESNKAKQFKAPSENKAGIYIFREKSAVGGALKKDLWVDGNCVGETAPGVFFYEEVEGDKKHVVSTESEFSPNDLNVETETGELYFIQQYIKMGAFVGGADLKQVDAQTGKAEVSKLGLAKSGNCSSEYGRAEK